MARIARFIETITEWAARLAAFAIPLMAGVMLYEVVARYVFGRPTTWAMMISGFILAFITFLGGAYTLWKRAHVSVDIFYGRFNPRLRATIDLVTFWIFLAFCLTLIVTGWDFFWVSLMMREAGGEAIFHPPIYPVKLLVPLGGLLLLLVGLADFVRNLVKAIKGDK